MEKEKATIDKIHNWMSESVSLKLAVILVLILILLIPNSWVNDLIVERQSRMETVIAEVSQKWSTSQKITGPILAVPYFTEKEIKKGEEIIIEKVYHRVYFLPEDLKIDADLSAKSLHRGLFDVVVYDSKLNLNGEFKNLDYKSLNIPSGNLLWEDARLYLGISDLRGIGNNPSIKINGQSFSAEPFSGLNSEIHTGIVINLPIEENIANKKFDISFNLKGSRDLEFIPVGKTTKVNTRGDWGNPSFFGNFLPENREVLEKAFSGEWRVLHFNRSFGQQFIEFPSIQSSSFGVSLLMPVDQYQKSIRSAKYSILIIALTFLALFLLELITGRRIHPFQYALVGVSLILYYSLLLSISEQLGFNAAYLISSLSTTILLILYSKTFFNSLKHSFFFGGILSAFYIFIFTIIREQDYALLIGSIGMFTALIIVMYFSRKIDWYKKETVVE